MSVEEFKRSLANDSPDGELAPAVEALWWDAKGNWTKAHDLIDHLEDKNAMAVHAYLHRKEGDESNAEYWYRLAGSTHRRDSLQEESAGLLVALL